MIKLEKEERRGRQADSKKGRRNAKESREGRRMDRRRDGRKNRWILRIEGLKNSRMDQDE